MHRIIEQTWTHITHLSSSTVTKHVWPGSRGDIGTQIQKHRFKNTDPRTQIHALAHFIVKKCMEWSWSALLCLVERLNVTKNNLFLLWLRSHPSIQSCHSTRATAKADVKLPGYIVPSSEICNSYVSPIPLCLNCNYHTSPWCGR